VRQAKPEEQAKWITANSPYVYVGQGLNNACNPEFVVLYDKMQDHGEGCNVLFADGHVEYVAAWQFTRLLQKAREAGQQIPEGQ
jgi:prepilin-type processing-associated H-X9-DG protein